MEWRLFPEGTVPEWTTPEWYLSREHAPHLEQPGHRDRLLLAADMVATVVDDFAGTEIVDLGAGDGGLLAHLDSILPEDVSLWGYDLMPTNVAYAHDVRKVEVIQEDVVANIDNISMGQIAIATEILEHLIDPHGFVRKIKERGASYLVASSPYTETGDSHYEFHTWAWDMPGYRKMLEDAGWTVLNHETAFICQVVLAVSA